MVSKPPLFSCRADGGIGAEFASFKAKSRYCGTMTGSEDITIRLALPEDKIHIAVLEAVLQSRSETDFAELLFQSVAAGERSVVLCFIGAVPVGYVILNWTPAYQLFSRLKIPELQDLNVLPDHRRKGLGKKLVAACENLARERGRVEIGLAVGLTQSYGAAQRLYARMGYIPDGQGITWDRQPVRPFAVHPVDDDLCLMLVKSL
ncbi:MAG: acetyltransferase family protein [Micavibrio sp.]|nr:acetyltransferase family protein [Micavibrio sp.]